MDLSTLVEYEKAANSVTTIKLRLLDEQERLSNQLKFYNDEKERAEIFNNEDKLNEAEAAISTIITRLEANSEQLQELDLKPLAERVWQEAMALQHKLKLDIQAAWGEAHKSRDEFLAKLKTIGELKHESEIVASDASKVRLELNQNPMQGINTNSEHLFTISLDLVNKLTRS